MEETRNKFIKVVVFRKNGVYNFWKKLRKNLWKNMEIQ